MSLKVQSRMYVLTSNGEREIQLCVGDITALPVEDKVDVILISAFPSKWFCYTNVVSVSINFFSNI